MGRKCHHIFVRFACVSILLVSSAIPFAFGVPSFQNHTPVWIFETIGQVVATSISPAEDYLVVATTQNFLYVFDINVSTPVRILSLTKPPSLVTFSATGMFVAVSETYSEGNCTLNLYRFEKGSLELLKSFEKMGGICSLAFSEDDQYLVAGTSNGYFHVFRPQDRTIFWSWISISEKQDNILVDVSANGQYILAGSSTDHAIYLFSKERTTPIYQFDKMSSI